MASLQLVFDLLARDRASSEFRKVGDAAERAGKAGAGFGSSVAGAVKLAAGAFLAAGIGNLFSGFVKDAQESAKISRLTAQVIKTTGGAAHITAGQVGELATAISNKTAVDDEAVQAAENLLLTFTKVRNETGRGNDIFNQATQAAIDLSAAMGTDANSAALQLGKALNDPIAGITALTRAGVSFTQQQKDQIRALVESGDILAAQKIILQEVQTQFGGAAQAAADPLERLKVIAGNLGEEIGGALLPVISRFASFLSDKLIPGIKNVWAGATQLFNIIFKGDFTGGPLAEDSPFVNGLFVAREFIGRLRDAAVDAFEWLRANAWPILQQIGGFLADTFNPLISALADFFTEHVVPAVQKVWEGLQTLWPVIKIVGEIVGTLIGVLGFLVAKFIEYVLPVIVKVAGFLIDTLGVAFSTLADIIRWAWDNVIKPTWDAISTAATWLWDHVLEPVFSAIGTAWDALGTGLGWVYDHLIKPVFDTFTRIVETVRDSFSTAVDAIKGVWDTLVDALKAPVQVVIDFVWNNGLRKLWNVINNIWGGDDIAPFQLASGGVLPGYTPGRDVHRFFSATGGILDLSGGEAVMRPEFTRALGKPTIDYLNQVARQEGEAGVAAALAGGLGQRQFFASGGTVRLGDRSVSWAENLGLAALPFVSPLGYNLIKPITDYIRQEASTTQDRGSSPWYSALGDMFRTGANKLWTTIKDEVTSWFSDERESHGGTFGGGTGGGGPLGSTWQSIWNVVSAAIPQARINSTFRLGDPGYHGLGKAIDFGYGSGPGGAGSSGLASINRFLYDNYGSSLAELIYDGAYDDRSDIKNGHNLVYSASTRADHQNHVHAAVYDQGGLLPPGLSLAVNGTGRPETIRTAAQEAALHRTTNIVVEAHTSDERRIARAISERHRLDEFLYGS